jgi:pimeloyl-ACP methyl ester carboxylesterase
VLEPVSVCMQRLTQAGNAQLCTEAFGDPADPPVLLIMGMGASMVWWEEGFCKRLADHRRYVIRYDHRDTGRSTAYEPGRPGYGSAELVSDAMAVLDGYRLDAAHVVGLSMGGALAQLTALKYPGRVRSLTLITTSPAVEVDRELPGVSDDYRRFLAGPGPDWSDAASVVEHLVEHWRVLSGGERPFDAERIRALASADVRRAANVATAQNHALLAGGDATDRPPAAIGAPTLVIHGTADPLFGLAHGSALADAIPDAQLLTLHGAGHGLWPEDWDTVVPAILEHTWSSP